MNTCEEFEEHEQNRLIQMDLIFRDVKN